MKSEDSFQDTITLACLQLMRLNVRLGHDFRPIALDALCVLQQYLQCVLVFVTTATANNRVVEIQSQLGQDISLQRGSPVRQKLETSKYQYA